MDTRVIKDLIKTIIPNNLLIHRLPRTASNSILLTFDDGPDEQITPQILERLKRHGAKALFLSLEKKLRNRLTFLK